MPKTLPKNECIISKLSPQLKDAHSHSVFRTIVYCLSATTHRINSSKSPHCFQELSQNQLTLHFSAKSHQTVSSTVHPLLIAAYTTELYLVRFDDNNSSANHCSLQESIVIKSNDLVYCSLPRPLEKLYFSIITKDDRDQQTSTYQCYLFFVDKKLAVSHEAHVKLSKDFSISCTKDPISGNCLEFLGKFFHYFIYTFFYSVYKNENAFYLKFLIYFANKF